MANFCNNCGAPVTGAFCVQCGNRITTGAAPAAAPAPTAPAPKPGTSPLVKLLFIFGGLAFLGMALITAGLFYAGYRAKQKINEMTGQSESARKGGTPSTPFQMTTTPAGNGCPFLSAQQAAAILQMNIERVESKPSGGDGEKCDFSIPASERARLAQKQIATGIGGVESAKDEKEGVKEGERLVTGALNILTNMDKSGEAPGFTLDVVRSGGKAKWEEMEKAREGMKTVTGYGMGPIEGVGDKSYAVLGGFSAFVLKGDTMFAVVFRGFAPGPEKTAALAKQIASGL
jgi:hypothetical protein